MLKEIQTKRADFASMVYIIMFLAIAGIVIFLVTDLNIKLFTEIDNALQESAYNNTEAQTRAEEFKDKSSSQMWDYAFLGIFFGSIIAVGLSAYAVQISPVFYWIYGLLSLSVLTMGALLSNLWQDLALESELASTINSFPITNAILGTYYPIIATGIIFIVMILLFGKSPGGNE